MNIRIIRKKFRFVVGLLVSCLKNEAACEKIFKLCDIYYNQKKGYLAVIELTDRRASLVKPIKEIVQDDYFIGGFDPIDARTLGYMSCYEQLRKKA